MTCPSELTCSRYVDGALPQAEASEFDRHSQGCHRCSLLVEALTDERMLLRTAMQTATVNGVIPAFVPRPTISRLLVWLGWTSLGIWAVSVAWMSLANTLSPPGWIAWLSPDALGSGIQLLVAALLKATGSGDLTAGLLPAFRSTVLATGALIAFGWLVRNQPGRVASLCLPLTMLSVLLTAAPDSQAIEIRRDDDRVIISAGEVIDDSLIILAEDVIVEGEITGDLLVVGETLNIRGNVGGLLVAVGETVTLEGSMQGSVVGIGETVSLRGARLLANLYSAGESVTVDPASTISGNSLIAAKEAEVSGRIGIDLIAAGDRLTLRGSVDGAMQAYAGSLELTTGAAIGGDLSGRLRDPADATIDPTATIGGETNLSKWPEERSRYANFQFYAGEIIGLLAAFITGLVLFRLIPALAEARLNTGMEALTTAGIGAVVLIATPALALAALITLIGAPIAILTFLIWAACLYFAGIVTAKFVGTLIMPGHQDRQALTLLVGLTILTVLANLPLLGGPIGLVAVIIGLGIIAQWLRSIWAQRSPV